MQEGWYYRAMANEQSSHSQNGNNVEIQSDEEILNQNNQSGEQSVLSDYKTEYQNLKKKLKFLLYENEFFQESLKSSQRRLLKVTRDRSYLLDRLLQYEKADCSSTESEDTESSDDEQIKTEGRKRKMEAGQSGIKNVTKKKRVGAPKKQQIIHPPVNHDEGLTVEEVERHLQSRLKTDLLEMIPSIPPSTLPNEMFSNEPSSESNEF